MQAFQQAQELKQFVEEVFALSRDCRATNRPNRSKAHTEITETEFATLDILVRSEVPMTVGDIQRQIGVLPAQMSRVIRSLENKGGQPLIACKINQADKRKIDVKLTDAGRKAHHDFRSVELGSIEKILKGLTSQDRNDLLELVRKVRVHYLTHRLIAS